MSKETVLEKNGKKVLQVELNGKLFELPFKEIAGNLVAFLDVSGQVDLIEHAADDLVAAMEKAGVEFDTILNPVSKSNALAHAVAARWGRKHPALTRTVVARKAHAGEHHAIEADYRSVTTDALQTMYLTDEDATWIKGKSILLMDDVYGQGGTTKALMELLEKAGAKRAGHVVAAAEDNPALPRDLIYLFTLPVFPLS